MKSVRFGWLATPFALPPVSSVLAGPQPSPGLGG